MVMTGPILDRVDSGLSGELVFDPDAGIVDITRTDGGPPSVERWRVVGRGIVLEDGGVR